MGKRLIEYTPEEINNPELQLVNVRFGGDFFNVHDIEIVKVTEKMVFMGRGSYNSRIAKTDIGTMDTYGHNGTCLKGDEERFAKSYYVAMLEQYVNQSDAIMKRIEETNKALERLEGVTK